MIHGLQVQVSTFRSFNVSRFRLFLSGKVSTETLKPCNLETLFRRPLHALQIDSLFRHLVKRRKLAQPFYCLANSIGNVVHFRFGIESTDAETDRAVR